MQQDSQLTTQVLIAIISSSFFGYMMKKVFDDIRSWIKTKQQSPFHSILPKIHEVYLILNTLMREVGCQSITIVKTENGGGKPKLGNPLFATIIYETFDYPLQSLKVGLQKEPLDVAYVKILNELDHALRIKVSTDAMEPGLLKDMFMGVCITRAHMFKIHESETRYIHLCLSFTDLQDTMTASKSEIIRQSVARLKKLFESEEKL